jgi:Anti-sigma factor NepR
MTDSSRTPYFFLCAGTQRPRSALGSVTKCNEAQKKMSGDMSEKIEPDPQLPTGKPIKPRKARVALELEIEENLKRVYQASLTEAVPDRFVQLLAQLRAKEDKT